MSAAFTPGPWEADIVAEVICGDAPAGFVLGGADGTKVVAIVTDARDATVLAAALELYGALDNLFTVSAFKDYERDDDEPPPIPAHAFDKAMRAARKALAKARGEQVPA